MLVITKFSGSEPQPKLKEWIHLGHPKGFVSGMMSIYDYKGEEIYSVPDHRAFQKATEGIGTPLFSYKGSNTTTHYFKAPSRDVLFVSFKLQGITIGKYEGRKFNWREK